MGTLYNPEYPEWEKTGFRTKTREKGFNEFDKRKHGERKKTKVEKAHGIE